MLDIKAAMAQVENLVTAGETLKADRLIRSTISKGATVKDIKDNLTSITMQRLNKFSRDNLQD